MLLTFLFEFAAAGYILWRYKMTKLVRLVAVMLIALGTFQISEYLICGGLGVSGTDWAKLGYLSITVLPPLGIHIITVLAGKDAKWLVSAGYATMAAFMLYFALLPGAVNIAECRPNYAVFSMHDTSAYIYTLYYYGWLAVGAGLAWFWSRENKQSTALAWLTGGYLAFMVPTTTANLVDPSTIAGIPSIMCGFAVLLAIILVLFVMPNSKSPIRNKLPQEKPKKKPA